MVNVLVAGVVLSILKPCSYLFVRLYLLCYNQLFCVLFFSWCVLIFIWSYVMFVFVLQYSPTVVKKIVHLRTLYFQECNSSIHNSREGMQTMDCLYLLRRPPGLLLVDVQVGPHVSERSGPRPGQVRLRGQHNPVFIHCRYVWRYTRSLYFIRIQTKRRRKDANQKTNNYRETSDRHS